MFKINVQKKKFKKNNVQKKKFKKHNVRKKKFKKYVQKIVKKNVQKKS